MLSSRAIALYQRMVIQDLYYLILEKGAEVVPFMTVGPLTQISPS